MLRRTTAERYPSSESSHEGNPPVPTTLLTITGNAAKLEGKFDITDSIQIECEIGGELKVGGKLVIGHRGAVHADVQTVDAIIHGEYEGNMVATGSVEITPTGRADGNIETNSLVISKGGFFNGNVAKLKKKSEAEEEKPLVHLVKDKQLIQQS
ncbi:MAG: polymer-forming cytoskeletal protein [Candidatus Methylomirabilales bacterium]